MVSYVQAMTLENRHVHQNDENLLDHVKGLIGQLCRTCISYSAVAEILLGPYCAFTVMRHK